MRDLRTDENVLYLDYQCQYTNCDIVLYSFARYCHRRKLDKRYIGFLCVISYKCLRIHDYLKIAKTNLKYCYSLMYNNVNLGKVTVWTWVSYWISPWIHHLLYYQVWGGFPFSYFFHRYKENGSVRYLWIFVIYWIVEFLYWNFKYVVNIRIQLYF